VNKLFANHERTVRVFEGRVSSKDRVVGLDDGARQLRCGVDTELELGLFAIVRGEPLEKESTKAGAGSSTEGVEDKEALETGAIVGKTANLVHDGVNELLADGVVAAGV
jgi:hypothetical protein